MTESDPVLHRPRGGDALHPFVHRAAIVLVILYVVSAWALFDRQKDVGLPLAMATVLLFVATAIPYTLWRIARRYRQSVRSDERIGGFGAWASGPVEVWQGRLKGIDATIDLLLPFAAVAFGLLALGIVFDLSR